MEVDQKACPTHGKYQTFRCFQCKTFLCPDCMPAHRGHKGLIRTDTTVHFLTYADHGYKPQHYLMLWMYDIPANKLTTDTVQNITEYYQESILIQHVIYIMGGLTNTSGGNLNKAFETVYAYDTMAKGGLVAKAPMLTPVFAGSICTLDDSMIYTIGGRNTGGYLDVCERYNIATNAWTKLSPLTKKRGNVSLGVFDCRMIYAVGGYTSTEGMINLVEVLDTKSDAEKWQVLAISPIGRKFHSRDAMCVVQVPEANELLLFGGCHGLGVTNDVFQLNLDTKKLVAAPVRLTRPAAFIQRRPLYYRGCYYLPEYGRKGAIYMYNLATKSITRKGRKDYIPHDLIVSKLKEE